MAGLPAAEVAAILRAQPRPQDWKELEVSRWLKAIELDVYAPTFEAAGVVGADLITMDAEALKRRLGVAHLGHRTKLLKEIAVLANRAMQHMRRGEEARAKDLTQKRKELMDSMYPDRVRRELKEKQDEKLVEARAAFWKPDSDLRKVAKPVGGGAGDKGWAAKPGGPGDAGGGRTRGLAHGKYADDTLVITEGGAMANMRVPADGAPHRSQALGVHPAQQRSVRPTTGGRQRVPRGGPVRRQTAGGGRAVDREAPIPGWQEGDGEAVAGRHRARALQRKVQRPDSLRLSLSDMSGRRNTTHKTRICTHWLRGACHKGPACTFAHGDEGLPASNYDANSIVDLAELGDCEAYGPDLAISLDQGVVSAVPAARRGPAAPARVPRLHPLQFEPPEWPPHSPTTKRALSNYEAFHGLPAGYATLFEVTRSCAALHGWAAWAPPRLSEELQLAFAMGTHARLGSGGQGCPYLMMPAELVERVVEACTIAMPRGAVARAHGLTV
jgi:hypothetical protein